MLRASPISLQQPLTTLCHLGCKLPVYQHPEMEIFREESPDWAAVLMGSYPPLSAGLPARLLLLPLLHLQKSDRHKATLLPFSTTCAITILGTCPNCHLHWVWLGSGLAIAQPCHLTEEKTLKCSPFPHEVSFTQTCTHSLLRISLSLIVSGYGVEENEINNSTQDIRHTSCCQEYSWVRTAKPPSWYWRLSFPSLLEKAER